MLPLLSLGCWLHSRSFDEGGEWGRGGEMLSTLAVGWRASKLSGEKAGRFHEVAGMSIVAGGGRQFNSRQPSGLNKLSIDRETFSGSMYAGFVLALSFHQRP